jgi:hypothetical protein
VATRTSLHEFWKFYRYARELGIQKGIAPDQLHVGKMIDQWHIIQRQHRKEGIEFVPMMESVQIQAGKAKVVEEVNGQMRMCI